jgi:hypothetical protein
MKVIRTSCRCSNLEGWHKRSPGSEVDREQSQTAFAGIEAGQQGKMVLQDRRAFKVYRAVGVGLQIQGMQGDGAIETNRHCRKGWQRWCERQ